MFGTYERLNISVWASNRCVLRAAQLKLRKEVRYNRACRIERHKFYRAMLACHVSAQQLAREWRL